jgi:hypothetical protein
MSAPTPPELPSFTNKTTFFALAQGLFVWLTTTFMQWVDATATAMNLNSTNDVSTSSVLIGTGSKSLTVSASKSYVGGMYVVISDNTTPGTTNSVNSMTGQITSYNSSTGALVVNVLKVLGSGTKTAWVISQCAPPSLEVSTTMQAVTSQTTLAAARTALGATTIGNALLTAASSGAALVLLDSASPSFSAYQSVAQAVPNSVFTRVQLQTEEFDTSAAFDNVSNYRFTPLVSGDYQISARTGFASPQSTHVCLIYKNGTPHRRGSLGLLTGSCVSCLIRMNGTTDFIEVFVYQASGGSQNLIASVDETFFQAVLIRSN